MKQKKLNSNQEYLNNLRHSCAHLLAAAVMELWPDTKRTIGPSIENGFYFDFEFKKPISDSDFPKIEAKMRQLLPTWKSFDKIDVSQKDAIAQYCDNPYKIGLINEFVGKKQKLTLYKSANYSDLCRGGHCEKPNQELKHFKLLKIAGAYWRGSEKNKMLTRIYGTCFPAKEELDKYLWQQEEAKKRDHKKLGKELGLFIFSNSVGPGLPLLMPKGAIIRRVIEDYLVRRKEAYGHIFVWTPHIARSELYKHSQHWQKYEAMMPPLEMEDDQYTLKPMNCPHHFQIYLAHPRSYHELPLRIAENGTVYRYEKSGVLNGLLRVRSVTQDDSHWFVPHSLLPQEMDRALRLAKDIFGDFGLVDYQARISIRDPQHKEKYLGEDKVWAVAEKELVKAVEKQKIKYSVVEGEAAFYGPKIDIMVEDALGREWQLSTIQLDFNQPENFDMTYVDKNGRKRRPVVLHIAILGSIERFLAALIEHYAGNFPLWLSPVQVKLIPIAERHNRPAQKMAVALKAAGVRLEVDDNNEPMQAKIRNATLQKVPYLGIIGDRESKFVQLDKLDQLDNSKMRLAVRTRDGKDLGQMTLAQFLVKLKLEIENKN